MKEYFGTKIVNAEPMTRGRFNKLQGWETGAAEDLDEAGYIVVFIKTDDHFMQEEESIHWISECMFKDIYQPIDAMSFGHALKALKQGYKVTRAGWNSEGMFLAFNASHNGISYRPRIYLRMLDGSIMPWDVSQIDLLADDWSIV